MERIPSDATEPIEYDAETGTYRVQFDPASVPPSRVVVSTVATIDGADVTALEPLADAVDAEALDRLFEHRHSGTRRVPHVVAFRYRNHHITVRGKSVLELTPADATD